MDDNPSPADADGAPRPRSRLPPPNVPANHWNQHRHVNLEPSYCCVKGR